jgi:hypothetical protein
MSATLCERNRNKNSECSDLFAKGFMPELNMRRNGAELARVAHTRNLLGEVGWFCSSRVAHVLYLHAEGLLVDGKHCCFAQAGGVKDPIWFGLVWPVALSTNFDQ